MTGDFFDKPFDEETRVKLELFYDYVNSWIPVIKKLKKQKMVNIKHPSFKYATVLKNDRTPNSIEIIK